MGTTTSSEPKPLGNVPECPVGIEGAGQALWSRIRAAGYVLREDEIELLAEICRERVLIECLQAQLDNVIATGELYVVGSQGQPVMNPVFGEVAGHRRLLAGLLKQLKLPDTDGSATDETTSSKARTAAVARWSRVSGG